MTCERAEKDDDVIQVEVLAEMLDLMELSRQKTFLRHKELLTDKGP